MNFKESIEAARLRVGAWNRERKERAAEKRAEKQAAIAQDQHAHSRFWLLNVPALATICAAVVEWYWAVLFCIEATGRLGMDWATSVGSDVPAAGAWHFLFDIQNVWVLIGLVLATMPIVMLSMIWLPVQFAMRGAGRFRRGSLIAVGLLANVLVIVSGTVVMNYNRQDQVRESVVIEQTAAQGRAAIDARLQFEQEQLRLALSNSNAYLNQAANVGAAEWERSYVAQARASNDPRLPMLERALGAARAADARRANIERLTIERAQAAPEAASAAVVDDAVGAELNTFAQYVEVWRPPFVAFICTLIGIFGAWWTLAMLERLNPRDVIRSGWADEGHRIEDLRDDEPVTPKPMRPAREVVTDAETGEELIRITPKPHWRKQKGRKQRVETAPDPLPDETGVEYDGGERQATSESLIENALFNRDAPASLNNTEAEAVHEPSEQDAGEVPHEPSERRDERDAPSVIESDTVTHPEPSEEPPPLTELSEEQVNELLAELPTETPDEPVEPTAVIDAEPEAVSDEAVEEAVSEELDHETLPEREEPETDPAKMIPANVAAE